MSIPVLPSFWVVIPAAGIGSRMQADRPKQYLSLAGRSILEQTLDCFLEHPSLKGLVVALAADDPYWPSLPCSQDLRISRVDGGAERADSVLAGLQHVMTLGGRPDDWVLVHDAARPNLSRDDLDNLLTTLAIDPVGGLLAVPARDTLKHVGPDGRVERTLDRSKVWLAYTPQMFRLLPLHDSLSKALASGTAVTDEASAMECAGYAPRLIEGRADNIKVTTPDDLARLHAVFTDKGK